MEIILRDEMFPLAPGCCCLYLSSQYTHKVAHGRDNSHFELKKKERERERQRGKKVVLNLPCVFVMSSVSRILKNGEEA